MVIRAAVRSRSAAVFRVPTPVRVRSPELAISTALKPSTIRSQSAVRLLSKRKELSSPLPTLTLTWFPASVRVPPPAVRVSVRDGTAPLKSAESLPLFFRVTVREERSTSPLPLTRAASMVREVSGERLTSP